MMRAVMLLGSAGFSRCSFSSGNSAVRSSNRGRVLALSGSTAVDGVDLEHRRVLLVAPGGTAEAGDVVALAQAVLAGELDRDVGIVAAGQVAGDPQEAVALVAQVEVAGDLDGLHVDRRARGRRRARDDRGRGSKPLLIAALRRHRRGPCCAGAGGGGCCGSRHRPRRRHRRRRHRVTTVEPAAGADAAGDTASSVTATSPDLISSISQSASGSPSGPRTTSGFDRRSSCRRRRRAGFDASDGVGRGSSAPSAVSSTSAVGGRRRERTSFGCLGGATVGRRRRGSRPESHHRWSRGSCRSTSPSRRVTWS